MEDKHRGPTFGEIHHDALTILTPSPAAHDDNGGEPDILLLPFSIKITLLSVRVSGACR